MKTVELCNTKSCAPNTPFEGLINTVKLGEQLAKKGKKICNSSLVIYWRHDCKGRRFQKLTLTKFLEIHMIIYWED